MAQQRSRVPQFGQWENEENVPYTVYFEKARQGRTGGKMINPNDPEENPDIHSVYGAPVQSSPSRGMAEPVRQTHQRQRSKEGSDYGSYESPARAKAANEPYHQRSGGRGTRPVRTSIGSENSVERSPLSHHARVAARGSAGPSPAREGKNSYDGSHGTPGRSRLKPESTEKGAAVPKFGEWENDPSSSGDGYTHIFNQVRQERGGGNNLGSTPSQTPLRSTPKDNAKCGCFPW
ncbi:hypothetical protein ACFE04_001345 [Oxalis oulophora]